MIKKLIAYIKSFFKRAIDENQVRSDIFDFIKNQPLVDYRELKRKGIDLYEYEVNGEKREFGSRNKEYEQVPGVMYYPKIEPVIPMEREYTFISSTDHITRPKPPVYYKEVKFSRDMEFISCEYIPEDDNV